MIEEITRRVLDHFEELQPGVRKPNYLIPILQSRRKVIIFLFDERRVIDSPLVVAKFYRSAENNQYIEDTTQKLQYVRSLLESPLSETIPRTVFLGKVNGLSVVAESVLLGTTIRAHSIYQRSTKSFFTDCHAFANWLLSFQKQLTTGSVTVDDNSLLELLTLPLQNYLEPRSEFQDNLLWLQEVSKNLLGLSIPLCWRYGDAHPSNILIKQQAVSGIIDWEGIKADEWPIFDWFQFTFSYAIECVYKTKPRCTHNDMANEALKLMIDPPSSGLAFVLQSETARFLSANNFRLNTFPTLLIIFLLHLNWLGDKQELLKSGIYHLFRHSNLYL